MSVAAVILAGAHVWREDALDLVAPRVLLPIANTPLIVHTLRRLRDAGIVRICLCVNDLTQEVRRVLDDGGAFGVDLRYFIDQVPRGPAGCVRDAAEDLDADHVVVLDGSLVLNGHTRDMLAEHRGAGRQATVGVTPGLFRRRDQEWWVPAGIYVFSREALELVPTAGFQDIKEAFLPKLRTAGIAVAAHRLDDESIRVTGLDSYLEAQGDLMQGDLGDGGQGYRPMPWGYAHERARLGEGLRVVGPVMIGPDAEIEDGVVLIGPTVIGPGCRIASEAVLANTVLWDDCDVGRRVLLDHTLVVSGARLSEGEYRARVVN